LIIIVISFWFLEKRVEESPVRMERLDAEELTVAPNPAGPGRKVRVSAKLTGAGRYARLRYRNRKTVSLKNAGENIWAGEFDAPGKPGRYELALLLTDYRDRDYLIKSTEWFLDVRYLVPEIRSVASRKRLLCVESNRSGLAR